MMTQGNKNHQIGAAAEHYVASWFYDNGYTVFWPGHGYGRADFVVTKDHEKFEKVQVKKVSWAAPTSGVSQREYLHAHLHSTSYQQGKGGKLRYIKGDFDVLAVTDGNRIWLIPFEKLPSTSTVCLDIRGPRISQRGRKRKFNSSEWQVK
jgi:hypothetical protein